jgi:hypothetical protein
VDEDNIKIINKIQCENMEQIKLARAKIQWQFLMNMRKNLWVYRRQGIS